jgi:hypothetical protein
MNLKRRLSRLEAVPAPRRRTRAEMFANLQRELHCPLPADATPEEHAHAVALLAAAQERLRNDRTDTGGLDDVRQYADSLHEKYSGS